MAFAAVISVERTIKELINCRRISLSSPCKETMEFAYQKLKSLRKILKRLDRSSKFNCRKKVNAVDERIKEAVWRFEDLIESHVNNQILSQPDQIHLQELRPDVDDFTQKLKKMEEEYIYELDHLMPEEASDAAVPSTADSDVRKVKMVGSSDILREIKMKLMPDLDFRVIAVVGMAGIGKTTLCKEIFDDSFELGFECRAWVTIGRRKYPVNGLERDILVQLDPNMEITLMEEILKTKRCLIVLDDVWDYYIWDSLKRCFSKEAITSRVLVTTRLQRMGRYVKHHWWHDDVYTMRLLNKEESWDLLRERVFGEDECPRELEKYGKKIADKCDGLPLMIVTVANLLSQAHKTAKYWKSVAENKKSSIFMAAYDQLSEIRMSSNLSLKYLMETNKLTGSNFPDWLRCLRLVLRQDRIEYVLDKSIDVVPDKASSEYALFDEDAHKKHMDDATTAQCVMLSSMTLELHRQHEHMFPYEMLKHLESLYVSQAQTMEYEILRDLFECKLNEGGKVSDHVLKMIGLIERLASIGTALPVNISVNLILHSLSVSFENFIVNFNMNSTKASLSELHNMLKTYESSTSKGKTVLMVSSSTKSSNSKGKNKQKMKKKAFNAAVLKPKGGNLKKPKFSKDECLFCHEKGHWKRDCPKFKAQGAAGMSSGSK